MTTAVELTTLERALVADVLDTEADRLAERRRVNPHARAIADRRAAELRDLAWRIRWGRP